MFFSLRWIASHVFVAGLVAAFVAAGLWQLNRLDERQSVNRRIEDRMAAPIVPLADLTGLAPEEAEYRGVVLTGSYTDRRVWIANRSDEGNPGFWDWTVFALEPDGEIIVNRGFVDRSIVLAGGALLADAAPRSGPVQLAGRLRTGIDGGRVSTDGRELSRPDAALAAEELIVASVLAPELYVELIGEEPAAPGDLPRAVPAPDLGEGPHRSYAFQWFTFAVMGVVGYGLVLRRIRRGDPARGDVPSPVP